MPLFPADHPVEALRNRQKLPPKRVHLLLTQRSLWLQEKIVERRDRRQPFDWCIDELAAVEQALEVFPPEG